MSNTDRRGRSEFGVRSSGFAVRGSPRLRGLEFDVWEIDFVRSLEISRAKAWGGFDFTDRVLSQEPEGERRAKSKSVVDQLIQELGRIGGNNCSVIRERKGRGLGSSPNLFEPSPELLLPG